MAKELIFTGRRYKIYREDGAIMTYEDNEVVAINSDTVTGYECAVNNVNHNDCRFDDLTVKYYKEE